MSKNATIQLSNCEKAFVLDAIAEGIRLDGRKFDEARPLRICFGSEPGSCYAALGDTKVTSHVSCKIEQPKQAKPNEGLLFINMDPGSMAAPNLENRPTELCISLNRLIEKCIIDSRCVDLESLCIVSEEKVWSLRVDIHVLNHAGNIIECASAAALASLSHFKRPDVTTDGGEITVHPTTERDPIPIVLHHYPVCALFAFFTEEIMVADPSLTEETACSSTGALFTIGMNSYAEVCLFNLAGAAISLGPEQIYRASRKAAERAKLLVNVIKEALAEDEDARSRGEVVGFPGAISKDKITTLAREKLGLRLANFRVDLDTEDVRIDEEREETVVSKNGIAALLPKSSKTKEAERTWASAEDSVDPPEDDDDDEEEEEEDVIVTGVSDSRRIEDCLVVSDDSEEDEKVVLGAEDKNAKPKKRKNKK